MSEGVKRTGIFFLVILGLLLFSLSTAPFLLDIPKRLTSFEDTDQEVRTIYVNGAPTRVLIADEPTEWERGLGGRQSFSGAQGMLFLFPEEGIYNIWMKDMYLSIDILWISAAGKVVHFEEGVSPDTYPTVFKNSDPAVAVLELPAGSLRVYGLELGSEVLF